jgi:hypothetical protein
VSTTAPSVEDVDRLIEAWEQRVALADSNLVALESEPTVQMLARPGGLTASLEGVTKQRLGPALEGMDRLFEDRGRLAAVVARAREERAAVSPFALWGNDEHLRAVVELLTGRSITMGTAPTPLASRALLGEATREIAITPEELLAGMARDYEAARDAVAALAKAWARLEPELEGVEAELRSLRRDGETFPHGSPVGGELAAIERELAHARRRAAVDPLGTEASFLHVVRPRLEALEERMATDRDLRAHVEAALRSARETLRALEGSHARARAGLDRAAERALVHPLPPVSDDDSVRGMAPWLDTLEQTALEGRWAPARVGLERWMQAARDLAALDDAALRALDDLAER